MDGAGRLLRRRDLRRDPFGLWLTQLPAGTVVAMGACSGPHHWAQRCLEHSLQPRLMAAQLVKPYRKSQHGKNDRNDAEAIATAVRQGNRHFVPIKDVDQQARLAWHRVREGYTSETLAISNRSRGRLAEFGIAMAKSDKALHRELADLHEHTALPAAFKEWVRDLATHWEQVRTAFDGCHARIEAHARGNPRCVRWRGIDCAGAITADAMVASLGKAQEFRNGRQLSDWLGMVPSPHPSGGPTRLGAISSRGDGYRRTLLIQGARSTLQRAKAVATEKATPEQVWIRSLAGRLPIGKVLVAIANKHARQLWVMLAHEVDYDSCASVRHPMHRTTQPA